MNGVMCRTLFDSVVGSLYPSAKLINALQVKPSEIKSQRIDMLMTLQTKRIEIYDVTISSLDGAHKNKAKLNKVDRGKLLTTSNPNCDKLVRQYKHLNSVKMDECNTKADSHISCARTKHLVRKEREPIAEQTMFGWIIMSLGTEYYRILHRSPFPLFLVLEILKMAHVQGVTASVYGTGLVTNHDE